MGRRYRGFLEFRGGFFSYLVRKVFWKKIWLSKVFECLLNEIRVRGENILSSGVRICKD